MKATLTISTPSRYAKMRAHTATHLLHAVLQTILGSTKQSGSLVDDDFVRFDFVAPDIFDTTQLQDIQTRVNAIIAAGLPVSVTEMSREQSRSVGAHAFFEEKYGDVVRVVSCTDPVLGFSSVELCGGTHVANTAHVGAFVIVGHESVASGIKRITAYTGPKVSDYASQYSTRIQAIAHQLNGQEAHIEDKITKLLDQQTTLLHDREQMIHQLATVYAQTHLQSTTHALITQQCNMTSFLLQYRLTLKDILSIARDKTTGIGLRYDDQGSYLLVSSDPSRPAPSITKELGLKGGGSLTVVQGKDEKVLGIVR